MMMLYMTRVILESVDPSITFIPFQFDAKFLQVNLCQKQLFLVQLTKQYDKRLFIDLPLQYMKTTSSEQFVYTTCSELFMY